MEAQQLVNNGARVRIGSGRSVSTLSDPWLPNNEDPCVHTVHDALLNTTVSQLMVVDHSSWDLDLINDLFIDRDINLITSIPLNDNEEDSWYWKHDHLGHYTMKSAYLALQEAKPSSHASDNSSFWRCLWNLKVPPKVMTFLWKTSTHCLSTKVQLQMNHVQLNVLCPFCNSARESTNYC